jgi:hypothetical protein
VEVTGSGEPVVKVTRTGVQEYDSKGGLLFYPNGRVFMGNKTKKGNWTCKTGSIEMAEQSAMGGISVQNMTTYVDTAVNDLDGFVDTGNLQSLKDILTKLKGKKYKGQNAITAFLDIYKQDEGDDFVADVKSVGVRTLGNTGISLKDDIIALVDNVSKGDGNPSTGIGNIEITWDGESKTDTAPDTSTVDKTPKPATGSIYKACNGFPYKFGCKSTVIQEVQTCLGLAKKYQTGNFGPITKAKLGEVMGDGWDGTITQETVDAVCKTKTKTDAPQTNVDEPLQSTQSTIDTTDNNIPNKPINGPISPSNDGTTTSKSGEDIYGSAIASGTLKGQIGNDRIKLKDGKNGVEWTKAEITKLDEFLSQHGYYLFKGKDRPQYEEKYVWLKKRKRGKNKLK